jgi:hypothetical protein
LLLLRAVVEPGIVEFMVKRFVTSLFVLLVIKCDNINDGLGIFLLFLLGDAVGFERSLPLFW